MNLKDLQQSWNGLAAKNAMWAVLTGPLGADKAWNEDAFFATGDSEIAGVLARVRALGVEPATGRALDFGCGVGRLSRALASRFARVDGVDISTAMLEQARTLNRAGDRCRFHLNERDDLSLFDAAQFDFVYSNIVLQHMRPEYSRRYIREFFRLGRPGGVVVFQVPADPIYVPLPQTSSAAPLPPAAMRAHISAPAQLRCAPGTVIPLRVMVRNDSAHLWPWRGADDDSRSLRLGNHWRRWWGPMLRFDDGRAAPSQDIAPGQEIEMMVPATAPRAPGRYVMELDMVQEWVGWFAHHGSPKTRIKVHVDASLPEGAVEGLPPLMEMHGIPRADVEALIASTGATLLSADEDHAPGPGWTSYRYIARCAG